MSFSPSTDYSDPLVPLDDAGAAALLKYGVAFQDFALPQRLLELQNRQSATQQTLAMAGAVAYNWHVATANPSAGETFTIEGDVFEFVAAAGMVADDDNIAVTRGSTAAISWANAVLGVNAAYGRGYSSDVFLADGVTPARANGTNALRAYWDATNFWVFAADAAGGSLVEGTAPDLDFSDTLTGSWTFANTNVSSGAGQKFAVSSRHRITITAGIISATPYVITIPFYSATMYARVLGYTSAGVLKEGIADSVSVAAGPLGTGLVSLALAGGGGDLGDTDVAWIEVWGPAVDTNVVSIGEAGALGGRIDALETASAALAVGRSKLYTFSGAGDQLSLTTTGETPFLTTKAVDANDFAIGDWVDYEAFVFVDGAVSTPALTFKLKLGTAILDTAVIATAAANDYGIIRGRFQITAATTCLNYGGLGEVKDATLTLATHLVPAALTLQALTASRNISVTATSDAGDAGNLVTLKGFRLNLQKAA